MKKSILFFMLLFLSFQLVGQTPTEEEIVLKAIEDDNKKGMPESYTHLKSEDFYKSKSYGSYNFVMNEDYVYAFNVRNVSNTNNLPILTLYNSKKQRLATNSEGGNIKAFFFYEPKKTYVFSLQASLPKECTNEDKWRWTISYKKK